MSAPRKKPDPDVSNALAMARRLEFLASCVDDPTLGAAARKRIRDVHAAAWRLVAGTASNAERVRLVRRAVIDAADAHATEPKRDLARAAGHACSRVGVDDPNLGARMRRNRQFVEAAVHALWTPPFKRSPVKSADTMRALLNVLKLPSSPRSGKGREPSGRAWPALSFKKT